MKNVCLFASVAVVAIALGCSRESSPTSPTRAAQELLAGTAVSVSAMPGMFGATVVDFARCLQGAADAACLSAARFSAHAVSGGAATAPGAPGNLSTSSSGSTVTLTWTAPGSGDATTGYVIEAGSAPGLANLAVVVTGSTATSFSATGIGSGTYYVRVRAQNASGTSGASNESTLVVGSSACTSAPGAPGGLAIATSGSTVSLTWTAPAGGCAPTSYVLQAGSAVGGSDLANSNVGNTTSYVATGVGNGTFYVRVRAANAYGQSAASNEFTLVVGSAPAPSPNPTTLDVQPRTVTYGTVSACSGGSLTSTFSVSAPANVTWNASIAGWPNEVVTPTSGSGSATVTLTVNIPAADYRCRDGLVYPSQGGMTIFFSTGPFISTSVRYSTALALFN